MSDNGSLLMRAAYCIHGLIAPCMPESLALSHASKCSIRRWIAQVDDAINNAMEVPMLIPGAEEIVSRTNQSRYGCKAHFKQN